MEDMEKLMVRTWNNVYEITLIDGRSGEVLVRGGQYFPELTPARLAGATLGGSWAMRTKGIAGILQSVQLAGAYGIGPDHPGAPLDI
jgi:hypothetical protein